MDPLVENIMVSQFEAIEAQYGLVYKLKNGEISDYLTAVPKASQPAIHEAIKFCSSIGWIPELIIALKHLYSARGMTLIEHLQVSHPTAITALLNHPIYLRQIDITKIQENMNNGSININCLRSFLRHPRTRRLMYLLTPPTPRYLQVFKEEKEMDRVSYLRNIYWSSQIARARLNASVQMSKLLYMALMQSL
jgi:hypothetical protein